MKYTFMEQFRTEFPIVKMSKVLGVSSNGFYSWLNRPVLIQKLKKLDLQNAIKEEYKNHEGMAGSPTIANDLNDISLWKNISRTRVARKMNALGLKSKTRKKWTLTTDSKHKEPIAQNLLNREFSRDMPNKAWVSDLTYLRVKSHWVYLMVFIDLFNRKVVGWDLSSSLETKSTVHAFRKAICNRKPPKGLLVHSDRRVQYASKDFRKELHLNNSVQSMSRKGNCWDNAVSK
jgi:putative transposase